jgi:hypothetical protein
MFLKIQSALGGKMSNTARFAMPLVALLLLGSTARVTNAAAVAPNDIDTQTGSIVSNPITFEYFAALAPAQPGFTSVQFLFTITEQCIGCTTGTDTVQVFYGPTHLPLGSTSDGAATTAFNAPCTLTVTVGATGQYTKNCPLSSSEANPNIAGSFINDFNNGGVSIVLACKSNCTSNFQDQFFFSGSTTNTANASMTLLPVPAASTPEPATGALLLWAIGSVGVLRIIAKARSAR